MDNVEERLRREIVEHRLSRAVEQTGQVSGARSHQVARLLAGHFALAHGASDDWELKHKSGRPTDEVLREELAKEDWQHFKDAPVSPAHDPGHVAKAVADTPPSNLADDLAQRLKRQKESIPGYIPARGLRRIS